MMTQRIHHFNQGYYTALDQLLMWLNGEDTSEMTGDQTRRYIYGHIMGMKPYGSSISTR